MRLAVINITHGAIHIPVSKATYKAQTTRITIVKLELTANGDLIELAAIVTADIILYRITLGTRETPSGVK